MKGKIWLWGGLLVLLGLTLACLGGGGNAQVEWKIFRAQGFQFSYPSSWNFVTMNAAGEAYVLYLPGKTAGTNIVVMRNPSIHADLAELEQILPEELEKPLFTSSELVEIQYLQLDGRQAVRLHARMTLAANQQDMESFQVATLLPDGQAAIFSLGIFKARDSEFAGEAFEQIGGRVIIRPDRSPYGWSGGREALLFARFVASAGHAETFQVLSKGFYQEIVTR